MAAKKPTRRIPNPPPKPPAPGKPKPGSSIGKAAGEAIARKDRTKDDKKDLRRPKVDLPRSVGQLPTVPSKETEKEPKRLNLSATKKKK
jgi:hypothetical protein